MILLIGKNNEVEEIIEESKFSSLGIWERTHMQEWIAKYPHILGEELLTITTEYDKFDKTNNRLDILAVDKNGKIVVIELKRDVADKFVDLQALHYAAYCSTLNLEQIIDMKSEFHNESKEKSEKEIKEFIENDDFSDFDNQPRIMLVANDFREETLAAVLWLRDNTLDITCVKMEPYKIGEKIVVNPDVIIPLPEAKDYMIQAEQKKVQTSKISKRREQYKIFWTSLINKVNELDSNFPNKNPVSYSYFSIPTGYGNIHFEWLFRGNPLKEFWAALHFEKKDYAENLDLLNYFKERSEEIKNTFPGEEVIFDEKFTKNWTQIYLKREHPYFDEENLKWGSETMVKLFAILKPILDEYYSDK